MLREARPPYVRFEVRQVEDRAKSLEAGYAATRDVIFVLVTQIGSSDTYENEAEAWLKMMKAEARMEPPRVPMEWVQHWEAKFKDYQASMENTIDGTSLQSWPMISKGQVENCQRVGCFTVEDLAQLNEDGIAALGMGGRDLKAKAAKWLEAATSTGKLVSENIQLGQSLSSLEERNRSLEDQVKLLAAQLETLTQPKKAA